MKDELKPCRNCGLLADDHAGLDVCVQALREAMIKQKEAASSLSFDMSTRFLAALEELALGVDTGIQFSVITPEGKPLRLQTRQVAGMFAAILRQFRDLGDWSPLRDAEKRSEEMYGVASKLLESLDEILALDGIDQALAGKARARIEQARQLGVRPPDPADL